VHFVFGLREQTEPFHLLHHLAIASCRAVLQPDEVVLHVHHLPWGFYWDLTRPLVTLARVEPVPEVDAVEPEPDVAPYRYAHHADVVRLDVLARHGGVYADMDTLFRRPVPDALWRESAVIGREAPVDGEPSLTNALLMAEPGAPFVTRWRDRILGALDGSWSAHSCRLAAHLADEDPDLVHVEPQARFSPFAHTADGLRALLEPPFDPGRLAGTSSVHLCAHLWWDEGRRDLSPVSASVLTEDHLRRADTALAHLARPHLPDHGRF
jgi:hypothetical protein